MNPWLCWGFLSTGGEMSFLTFTEVAAPKSFVTKVWQVTGSRPDNVLQQLSFTDVRTSV
jgi:hypothetical protein